MQSLIRSVKNIVCLLLLLLGRFEVLMGANSLYDQNEGRIKMKVDKVIRHKDYDKKYRHNDIMLLHVDKDIVFNDYVGPLCLLDVEVPVGTNCIVASFVNPRRWHLVSIDT